MGCSESVSRCLPPPKPPNSRRPWRPLFYFVVSVVPLDAAVVPSEIRSTQNGRTASTGSMSISQAHRSLRDRGGPFFRREHYEVRVEKGREFVPDRALE